MQKWRILFITSATDWFGSEKSLLNLVKNLTEYKSILLLKKGSQLRKEFEGLGIDVISVNSLNFLSLFNVVKHKRPDIIHINYHQDLSWRIVLLGILFNMPIVVHKRMVGELSFTESLLFLFAERVICVSKSVRESILRTRRIKGLWSVNLRNLEVVYDGIDLESLKDIRFDFRKKYNVGADVKCAGIVGSVAPRKRQDLFVEIAHRFIREKQDLAVKFFIVGGLYGERHREYLEHVKRLVHKYGIEDNVVFTGREHVPSVMNGIDVLLSLSESEAFGLVVVEAMSCGVPVIAMDNGEGPAEILSYGGGCLASTAQDVIDYLDLLLRDEFYYQELSDKAKSVAEIFSIKSTAKNMEIIYSDILEKDK